MPISSLPDPTARIDTAHSHELQQTSPTTYLTKVDPWKTAQASPPGSGLRASHGHIPNMGLAALRPQPPTPAAPGMSLDASDRHRLTERLDPALLGALSKIRLRPGLCHTDVTLSLIRAAGGTVSPELRMLSALAGGFGPESALAGLLDAWIPLLQLEHGHLQGYSMHALREHGVPPECLAVLLYERQHAGGRAFAVFDVNTETGQSLCFHSSPGAAKGMFSKIDITAFEKDIPLRTCGGMAKITRASSAEVSA